MAISFFTRDKTRLLRRYAPRNDNEGICHCEASRREAVAISIFKKEIYLANEFLFLREIAAPDRFSGQARNERPRALLSAMTKI